MNAAIERSDRAISSAASPIATPSAKTSRPLISIVTVAAENHQAPSNPPRPKCASASLANSHAAATAADAPSSRGPNHAPNGGKSTL